MVNVNTKSKLTTKLPDLEAAAYASSVPIWRAVTSRQMANLLGVTVQTLANWRVREQGPRYSFAPKGKGNKCLYRLSEVLEWLSGRPSWEIEGEWLAYRGLGPEDPEREYVEWVKSIQS